MRKETTISVSIQIDHQSIDLQIPIQVTVERLKELLSNTLAHLGVTVPLSYQLVVVNKPIRLSKNCRLSDYPIGNGDQLLIQAIEGGEKNENNC